MLALAFGPRLTVPAVIIVNFITATQLLPGALKAVDWRRVVPMGLAGCIGLPIGIYVLATADQTLLRRAIALISAGFAVILMTGWRYRRAPPEWMRLAVGAAGGTMAGAAGIGGPPVILFLLGGGESALKNRATFIIFFATLELCGSVMFGLTGAVTAATLWLIALMAPALVLGAAIGQRAFGAASERGFRRFILGFLFVVGIVALVM